MTSVWIMACLMIFYAGLIICYLHEGSYWKALYFLSALMINFSVYKMR